jgi:N-acetylglucosamine-6-phosphate deacetylase
MKETGSGHFNLRAIHYGTGMPVDVEIINGLIGKVREIEVTDESDMNLFVSPGLIDNQINGYAGVDFSGNSLNTEAIRKSVQALWSVGVTSFLPTLITNSHENLIRNLKILSGSVEKDENLRLSIPGFHLEGPYISPDEGYRGCHPIEHIRKPSKDEFSEYQEAAGGKIIEITLAPETDGAMELIKICSSNGIVVALGHTNATTLQITEAVGNGARVSTHLGNGCANLIHRHYNPIWPQLANDLLAASVIADGLHLLPEELRVFYKIKGPENLILTSDVIYISGMKPGNYDFLDSEVTLTMEGKVINTELNCLAGASFPLKTGVENMMSFTGCSLTKAINMASLNVANLFGLSDRGRLETGKRADLILFRRDENRILIEKTFLNGKMVYSGE